VLVESGASVKAGQVLARLDDTPLRLAVQQAEDALAVARLNRDKLLAAPTEDQIAVARANLRAANASAADLQKGAGVEQVTIAQIKYDNAYSEFKRANDQYNGLVQFAKDYPRFAPPQDTLDSLKASMEQAYYASEVARLQLEQVKQGAGKGQMAVAYAQVLQAQAILSQTLAAPPSAQVDQANLAIDQAATALDRARLRLTRAEVTAPYDGVVSAVNVKAGEPAPADRPAFVVLDPARYHLDVTVDEVDVAQLAVGQAVSVTVEALPGLLLGGHVDQLAPTATIQGGLVNYSVRLVLEPTEAPLRAGMSATARVTVAEVRDAVLVPNWAIRRDRRTGQAFASLKQGEALVEVPITTGLRGEAYTEILGGVDAGEVAAISTQRDRLDILGGGG
jgi:HlyD family secretion protein